MKTKKPNPGHYALFQFEQMHLNNHPQNTFTLITQNVDGLHLDAGSKNVIEMHGSLWRTQCTSCGNVKENRDSPITASLAGVGSPDIKAKDANIPVADLPRCQPCGGLLRPCVVWFGEALDGGILDRIQETLQRRCDLLIVVGTSVCVQPHKVWPLPMSTNQDESG